MAPLQAPAYHPDLLGLQARFVMLNALIVEDNAAHRQSLRDLLAKRFPLMLITEAEDAETALRQATSRRFDLVFVDIRLPRENGLNLTRSIKTVHVDAVVCVITSYDILEYREAAYRNGADYFMVKGESSEAEIVRMVEALLHSRFICLVALSDPVVRKQVNMLLAIHWPGMIVAEATGTAVGGSHLQTLRPNLVLLGLDQRDADARDLIAAIRDSSPQAIVIGMVDETGPIPSDLVEAYGVDHCVSMTPFGHTELVGIVSKLHPERVRH